MGGERAREIEREIEGEKDRESGGLSERGVRKEKVRPEERTARGGKRGEGEKYEASFREEEAKRKRRRRR